MIGMPEGTWAIAGGKGGVGKSVVTLSAAYWLGRLKHQVALLDGDLGGANLHTMLGVRIPPRTLDDFVLKRVPTLDDLLLDTSLEGVRLIAGGSDTPALANPNYAQKTRLLRAMAAIETDLLLVDLGAGTSLNTLDLFLAAPNRVVVLTPQPTSIQNAYGFIKAAFFRLVAKELRGTPLKNLLDPGQFREAGAPQTAEELFQEIAIGAPDAIDAVKRAVDDLEIHLIVNMIRSPKEEKVGPVVSEVCRKFLGVRTRILGAIPYDPKIERWALAMEQGALIRQAGDGGALRCAYDIAYRMADRTRQADSERTKRAS
ncbi:MAG: P-loop NTPase [Candidatus Eisenbacteria bacterium]|uniref:P-loop NTPase n=1 Tax=Eiseniibacteriota bacterium TaxID=2212470 RepID=A0A956NFL2_UNCEI|nr:P-loop NTPase [Candidatus Eisenbacteria bacterium]MCB9464030.1 P-loop NTPase [Candidatus Eisenbacteria bacterium]